MQNQQTILSFARCCKMNELKTSVKKRASNKKYDDAHYKTITYKAKISDYKQIKEYAEKHDISVSQLCKQCVKFVIDSDIDISK